MRFAVQAVSALALACGAIAVAQETRPTDDQYISVMRPPVGAELIAPQDPVPLAAPAESLPPVAVEGVSPAGSCCDPCCTPTCVPTTICLVDPCGCSHEACVNVPACCVGQQPEVCWRGGVLGRQVATLCWPCCDFEAKVIVARNGKVRVRG
jgi:hypothetical protein